MAEEHTALIDGLRVRMTKYAEQQRRIETIDYDSAAQYFASLGAIPVATWPIDLKFSSSWFGFSFRTPGLILLKIIRKPLHDLCTYFFCGLEGRYGWIAAYFFRGPLAAEKYINGDDS